LENPVYVVLIICWLQAERARKNSESELSETSQRITELTTMINSMTSDRSRFETEISSARADIEDALRERAEASDRAARLQVLLVALLKVTTLLAPKICP